jgi:hypothetical protein
MLYEKFPNRLEIVKNNSKQESFKILELCQEQILIKSGPCRLKISFFINLNDLEWLKIKLDIRGDLVSELPLAWKL